MDASRRRADTRRPAWHVSDRQLCDLELLITDGFLPLEGFLGRADYESVLSRMRLDSGELWPIPVTLDVNQRFIDKAGIRRGSQVELRHPEGLLLALLDVTDVWKPDRTAEARAVYGTDDADHPGVFHLLHETNDVYVGGRLLPVERPIHHTYQELRHSPDELRSEFERRGWSRIVAFQTRNPMHRAHVELVRQAAHDARANLLIHPVVGRTRPGDIDYFNRVRCYQAVLGQLPATTTMLSLLPLSMRMAGPREAVWHALIRRNHGATHFIVGRDHAGPGTNGDGKPYYEPDAAQALARQHQDELGIEILPYEEFVYVEDRAQYLPVSQVPAGARTLTLSGTELRRRVRSGLEIPTWFTFPSVVQELRRAYPPRNRQGFTVFFTGLSGSGKSTIANILLAKLLENGSRPVTLLDGDIVRTHLSSELGFSRRDRDINIRRIGFVASEITKNRGIALCAPIAPYEATRRIVRSMIEDVGGFVLVHVATPLKICEARDRKGLYAKARAGLIKDFTGIDDPYEEPADADLRIDTQDLSAEQAAQEILLYLEAEGFLDPPAPDT